MVIWLIVVWCHTCFFLYLCRMREKKENSIFACMYAITNSLLNLYSTSIPLKAFRYFLFYFESINSMNFSVFVSFPFFVAFYVTVLGCIGIQWRYLSGSLLLLLLFFMVTFFLKNVTIFIFFSVVIREPFFILSIKRNEMRSMSIKGWDEGVMVWRLIIYSFFFL